LQEGFDAQIFTGMKALFVCAFCMMANIGLAQSIYVKTDANGFLLFSEFSVRNGGVIQTIQNENGTLLEVNYSRSGVFKSRKFSTLYRYSFDSRAHIFSDDMTEFFEFDFSNYPKAIGGKSLHKEFHAPDTGPFVFDEINDTKLEIDLGSKVIEEINGKKVELDFVTKRPINIGNQELQYSSTPTLVVIKE
jgi:hypothetical protein